VEPPVMTLVSADPVTGTITLSFSQDPAYPLATTTITLIDPTTMLVVATFAGLTPPVAVLGPGILATAPYIITATTYDAGSTDFASGASITLLESGWDATLKTVLICDAVRDAVEYTWYATPQGGARTAIGTSEVHTFIDSTVYPDEDTAALVQYDVEVKAQGVAAGARIVSRWRTTARLCLITGSVVEVNSIADREWPVEIRYKLRGIKNSVLRQLEIPPYTQGRMVHVHALRAHPNHFGKWGMYLLQDAVVEILIQKAVWMAEFSVPALPAADISALPVVPRVFRPTSL